jgi:phospholipase/carboxylesterase
MMLDHIVVPDDLDNPDFTILGLHGRNASGSAFLPFVRQMQFERTRWILPSAPYAAPDDHDVRWWFEHEQQNTDEIASSRLGIGALIDAQIADGVPPENIFLIGFSQGAVMALDAALRYPRRLGGVAALSGYVAHPDLLSAERHPANMRVPIFLAHGIKDDVLTIDVGRRNSEVLSSLGCTVDYREYDTAHRISSQETKDIRAFLHRHMYGMEEGDPRIAEDGFSPF